MKNLYFFGVLLTLSAATTLATAADTPPTDTLCASQVLLPMLFRPGTENVTVYEPSVRYATTPVQIGYGERKVKIADAYEEYSVIPAKFGEVTETIEVQRERIDITTIPATYRTETKRVKVKDATQRWNPTCPAVQQAANAEGVPASCLLAVAAEYTDVTRQVVAEPARTIKTLIPARTETVTHKVLLEPAKVVRKEIPAVYTNVKLARVDQVATVTTTPQPERMQAVPAQQTTRADRIITMPALCEATVSREKILQLQQQLYQRGYYQGTPDGELGPKTRAALTHFQDDNQLASGAMTLESLQKLQLQ
jgi:hypothetical protein